MWDGHLQRINGAKHRIVLNPKDAPPIHPAPHTADLKHRELEREEVAPMEKAGVA